MWGLLLIARAVMTTEKKGGRKVHLTNTVYPLVASPPPPKPRFRLKDKGAPTFAARTVTAMQNWPLGRSRRSRLSPGGECPTGLFPGFFEDSEVTGEVPIVWTITEDSSGSEAETFQLGVDSDSGFAEDTGAGIKVVDKVCGGISGRVISLGSVGTSEALRAVVDRLPRPNRKIMGKCGRCATAGLYSQGGFKGVSRFAR